MGLRADHRGDPRPVFVREEQHRGGERVELGQQQIQDVRRRAAGQPVQVLLMWLNKFQVKYSKFDALRVNLRGINWHLDLNIIRKHEY